MPSPAQKQDLRLFIEPDIYSMGIPAIIWRADPATLQFWSVEGAAEEILGYPRSHWLTQREFFEERIYPEDRAPTLALYRAALAAGGDASAEYRAVSQSGETVWCRETIRLDRRWLTGVVTNITRRKELERLLLSVGRYEAQYALAGRLAHDLNNPLMIVTGYAEEALRGLKAGDPMWVEVSEILSAAQRIADVTAQLVDYSRPQARPSGRTNLSEAIANLRLKITEAVGDSVTVELRTNQTPVWAMVDAEQLGEVITALVAGARESARERTRITISWGTETIAEHLLPTPLAAGRYARIAIHDDGKGVEASQSTSVFDLALSPAANPEAAATDLTLARAYSLVREWGGDIGFTSQPAPVGKSWRGSVFSIFLPSAELEAHPFRAEAAGTTPLLAGLMRETIILVDDEPVIRALISKILSRERYRVIDVANAEEAMTAAAAQQYRIDLLVTDVMLPGPSGFELARKMKQASPGLKVLFISGYSGQQILRPDAYPLGARLLAKPFTLDSLLSKVRETLGSSVLND